MSDLGVVYSGGMPLAAIGGVGVNLRGRRVLVCDLVAGAFVPGRSPERRWVRHLNGDVTDNRASNLEWSAERERRPGRRPERRAVRAWTRGGDPVGQWGGVREASAATGVPEAGIRAALRGEIRSSGGLLWGVL